MFISHACLAIIKLNVSPNDVIIMFIYKKHVHLGQLEVTFFVLRFPHYIHTWFNQLGAG